MKSSDLSSQESSIDSKDLPLSDYTGTKPKFKFSTKPRRCNRLFSTSTRSLQSDSSNSDGKLYKSKQKTKKTPKKANLPPLGIFWDIENCQVPRQKSASAVVQRIREFFLQDYREAEFLVVCDVKKERSQVIQELHDSQVNLIHVSATSKNAADEKLRQSLRRFAEVYSAPACCVLISSDINFAADLSDLRYRKKIRVVLVHNTSVADALVLCANQHYCYSVITEGLPPEKAKFYSEEEVVLQVSNLPTNLTIGSIKNRLNMLTSNCGGRTFDVHSDEGCAWIRFCNQDFAQRAQKRIQGEDVFGNKIKVVTPSVKSYSGRKIKGNETTLQNVQANGARNQAQDSFSAKELKRYPYELIAQEFNNRTAGNSGDSGGFGGRRRVYRTSCSSEFSDDGAKFDSKANQPVDLIISNLDPSFSIKELRRLLTNMIKEHVMILNLNVLIQTDGSPLANIKVNNQQAAQYVISQLHRQKLGHKRIVISSAQSSSPDVDQLRAMVISILQEVPDNHMPLYKLIELLESRYHCTVSVSDVNKLKDICKITDNFGSRMISFTDEVKSAPLPSLNKALLPYCTIHCPSGLPNLGWCELNTIQLPNLAIPLKLFTTKLNTLLNLHMGSMQLLSFQACYEQVLNESLPIDSNGVPIEHLISCVENVQIRCYGPNKNIKIIQREVGAVSDEDGALKNVPQALAPNISLLCRELVDLLKTTDRCQLLLSKFIPAYHHHFGRQCHVADYGYTKLLDLFESISHVVQVMGDGTRKIITLTHQAQMRRFTSDLLRVLKVQPAKQILINDFASVYEKVMNKSFNSIDYGLCSFADLLSEVPENIIVLIQKEDEIIISVPKREQTAKEIARTKQFALEVIDILQYSPNFTMLFNKFVPVYHHHFGHQCRVADYGFSKLIELFEAIPDVVKINELDDEERTISLTLNQSLRILGAKIVNLIKNLPSESLLLEDLPKVYFKECGYPLHTQTYECETLRELMDKLIEYIQVVQTGSGPMLCWVDTDLISIITIRAWALLLKPPYCKELNQFQFEYKSRFNVDISTNQLKQLRNIVSLSYLNDTNYIVLTDLYILVAELYHLLYINGGSILFSNVEEAYFQCYGKAMNMNEFGINSMEEMYEKFDFVFFGCGYKKSVLALNRKIAEHQIALPAQIYSKSFPAKKWGAQQPSESSIYQMVQQSSKKVSPPKPDTPPTPTNVWQVKSSDFLSNSDLSFSLNLPINLNPVMMGNPYDLISPSKQLFSFSRAPWNKAPDPAELPMPDQLIGKGVISDDSNDSGVNSKLENSAMDNESKRLGACGSGAKRRLTNFLNFSN